MRQRRLTQHLTVRLNPDTVRQLEDYADREDLTVSEAVRAIIHNHLLTEGRNNHGNIS